MLPGAATRAGSAAAGRRTGAATATTSVASLVLDESDSATIQLGIVELLDGCLHIRS
jgi:hypothetical protein